MAELQTPVPKKSSGWQHDILVDIGAFVEKEVIQ
jgi:hypothetical protein